MPIAAVFGIIVGLIPIVVLVAIIYVVFSRRNSKLSSQGIGVSRRLYLYTVAIAALVAGISGVVLIAAGILDGLGGSGVVRDSMTGLAVGLAMTVVGIPLWYWHWRMIIRAVEKHPSEKGTLPRKLYIYVILGVAIGFMTYSVVEILQWGFRIEDNFRGFPWAALIIWGGVWIYHWRVEYNEGQPTTEARAIRSLYIYTYTCAAIILLATGLAQLFHIILTAGYEALVSISVFDSIDGGLWQDPMRQGIILALVGGLGWYVHWLRFAARDYRSPLRRLYVGLFGTYGGFITVLVSLVIIVNRSLLWGLADSSESAPMFFEFFPATIVSLTVGFAVGIYHYWVGVKEGTSFPDDWKTVREWTPCLLMVTGLVLLAVGIIAAASTLAGMLASLGDEVLMGELGWGSRLALAISLGLFGGPLWWAYWKKVQSQARQKIWSGRSGSWSPRRTTLSAIVIAGLLALLGALSHVLFVVFRDLLGGNLSGDTVLEFQISIGVLLAISPLLPYYWTVYRNEQPESVVVPARRRKRDVSVLASEGSKQVVRDLESALGYPVEHMEATGRGLVIPSLTVRELKLLARQIDDVPSDCMLVILDGSAKQIYPYRL